MGKPVQTWPFIRPSVPTQALSNRSAAADHYNAVLAVLHRCCLCEPEGSPPYRCDFCKVSDDLWTLFEAAKQGHTQNSSEAK